MNIKKLLLGSIAGGIATFLSGWLIYGILLADFFTKNVGSATGVTKNPPDFLWLGLGNIFLSALVTYIFLKWANIQTFAEGAMAGAVIGLLMGLGIDFSLYGTSNMSNLTAAIVDGLLTGVQGAVSGAVVGWVLGRNI